MAKTSKNNFLKSIKLRNFLSYGDKGTEIKLKPLNVFIGANASGKSNLIEAIRILKAAAQTDPEKDISGEISKRDGILNWIWKGKSKENSAEIQLYTDSDPRLKLLIEYNLKFQEADYGKFEILEESLIRKTKIHEKSHRPKADYFYSKGSPPILVTYPSRGEQESIKKNPMQSLGHANVEDLDLNKSVLSQRKDPVQFPNITFLANQFDKIKIYRGWNLEYDSPIRNPQKTDKYQDFLLENASNLSLIISSLLKKSTTQKQLEDNLKKFYPNFVGLDFGVEGGIQVRVEEKGLYEKISAKRLSDGFIRFLCILAILCHPKPPPVICLEEPELNMHPDIIPTIAELLVEASKRTQLFVTTHSDILVSALSDTPESVIVCDRNENGTRLKRLKRKELELWLEDYLLGDIWLMNKIGGNP
ncbi:AAA family ATPase [bacterium]|nr:AAA family ATPase [bacterium]